MSTTPRAQRRYDHRLKQLVRATGKIDVARESGVPRSAAYGWLNYLGFSPLNVPVLLANLSVSRPSRCNIETNRFGKG
jgi:putative transposase